MEKERDLERVIDASWDLPPPPFVAVQVIKLIDDPQSSAAKLKRIVANDQALAARVLKIANSPFYGCIERVKDLRQAIVILGFNAVRNLAIAASLNQLYKKIGLMEKMLWEHGAGAAIASYLLAKEVKMANPEESLVAGLMHDIGKVILYHRYPQKFSLVFERVYNQDLPFTTAEKEVFNFTHTEVGALLIRKWNFPLDLGKAIRFHHELDTEHHLEPEALRFIAIVNLADLICSKLGIGYRQPKEDLELSQTKTVKILNLSQFGPPQTYIPGLLEKIHSAFLSEKTIFFEG